MPTATTHQRFRAALDALVEDVKQDRSILAAILCGSLSHDTVWDKSDIDLGLITIDDKKLDRDSMSLYADGVNVHAFLIQRAQFRKLVEGAVRNSFIHSLLAKGQLLYTHDESIEELFAGLRRIGERDTKTQLLHAGTSALPSIYKAHKWWITRGDLDYTALWILYAATPLAKIEVLGARMLVDREVILQAMKINPSFFSLVYTDILNAKKTKKNVQAALDAIDEYMAQRAPEMFATIIDHLRDVGEARSVTEIDDHFRRNFGTEDVLTACEYLADQGLISKVSTTTRLTKRSNVDVQELAFVYMDSIGA